MEFVSLGIIILIIVSALGGRYHGGMNKVFTFEKWALIFLLLPKALSFLSQQLLKFTSNQVPEFIFFFVVILFLYAVISWIFRLLTIMIKEEAGGIDSLIGFIMGGLKMFLLVSMIISFYGICFLDIHIPLTTAPYFKKNIVNKVIKHEIEYYRESAYNSYKWIKESDIYDVTSSNDSEKILVDGTVGNVNNKIQYKIPKVVILPPYLPKYSWLSEM